jgi:signal transduction histidine kinase
MHLPESSMFSLSRGDPERLQTRRTLVRISISLHEDANVVGFAVSDNGLGFDVANATAGGGLQHMRDRIGLLGGRLSIVSEAGVGTVVSGAISSREYAGNGSIFR